MKKDVLKRWLWCVLEYLMVFPFILIIAGFILPVETAFVFTLVVPFHMLASLMIAFWLKRFNNLLLAGIGLGYTALVSGLWLMGLTGEIGEIILTVLLTAFGFIWGIRAGVNADRRNLFFYAGGLAVHGLCLILFHQAPALNPLSSKAVAMAIIYVIAGFPLANRRFLIQESRQKSSLKVIPGTVLQGHRKIIAFLMVGVFILSLWRVFLDAFRFLTKGIVRAIVWIIDLLNSLFSSTSEEGPPPEGGMEDMLPPAEESGSLFATILNILAVLFLGFLLFLFIRYLVKHYKRIYQAFCRMLSSVFGRFQKWGTTGQGYVDLQESLLATELKKKPPLMKRLFKREPKWRDMKDNPARVRFIYTKFITEHIRKGFPFRSADTPGEVLSHIEEQSKTEKLSCGDICEAYNDVRYGDKKPCDECVKALKEAYLK